MELYANIIGIGIYMYLGFIIFGSVCYIEYALQRRLYGPDWAETSDDIMTIAAPAAVTHTERYEQRKARTYYDAPPSRLLLENAPQAVIDMEPGTIVSGRELARLVGVSASYLSYWKNGKKPAPAWMAAFEPHKKGFLRL